MRMGMFMLRAKTGDVRRLQWIAPGLLFGSAMSVAIVIVSAYGVVKVIEAYSAYAGNSHRVGALAAPDWLPAPGQAAIATELGFAPRSVTDLIDALEREGFAQRFDDPADRRSRLIRITDSGACARQSAGVPLIYWLTRTSRAPANGPVI
ncbi:MAG: hypothetical protein B7X08_07505 [Acidocella sp. 20-63-7]|nr:MAG: hypothetical protein B7X08_07505 [Acidocella sp. 20-63-7]